MLIWLSGKKAYIVGIIMILYGAIYVGWETGDWKTAWESILGGMAIMGLRAGITKSGIPK